MQIIGARVLQDGRLTRWGTTSLEPELTLDVVPLRAGWGNTGPREFESGAGPIFALEAAMQAVDAGADKVLIRCVDHLRSGYERSERAELMRIFGDASVPEAYTTLAQKWCGVNGFSKADFERVARALETNYRQTAESLGLSVEPPGQHDKLVTDWFRRVDCANPNIDFECDVWCVSDAFAADMVGAEVCSVSTMQVPDGPNNIGSIVSFDHLAAAVSTACSRAGYTIDSLWNEAVLELYTCFPIVPLAFLLATGLADDVDDAVERIESRPITLSGGMTLGRAPWNGPALRALALASENVANAGCPALIHGNGGLGGKQAIAILGPRTN